KNPFASLFGGKKKDESPLIKKESFFKKNRFVFLAFAVPLVLMTYSFAVAKLYPFGDNQIMVIDMWHQFFEFFKILHEKLQHFGSLLYTWDGGLGTNFIALISYYAASPLYLLSVFVPTEYLTEALAVVVILKISFSGAFMCIYLRTMFKRCDFGTATFSILYALSAFAMGYYWCVMWLDVMALLPLCLLGLNKLVDEGKFKLYVLSLALMLISNYYIGIMMCMFIVIYYPVIYFSRLKPRGAKYFIAVTVKTAFFSALAACIAAVILIPTYFSMQNTYYIEPSFPQTNSFYNPILDVISNLLPNVDLTVRGGLPNIYCGVISFMMAVLFLLCKKIPVRQKILNCSVLAFLILSFNWNKLDYIWHCLHFPNELPYRYSFAFTFVLITMAYQAYLHLDDLTPGQIGGVTAGGFIYMILAEKLYSDKFDYTVIYVSLGILAAYAIVLAIHKTGRYKQAFTGILLFIVAFAEMTNYTISSVQAVGSSSRSGFYANYDDVTSLIEKVEKDDPSFYRMEIANHWTTNDPALYGYRGVAQFSSEINAKVTALMKSIGLAGDPASNRFGYAMSTPVVNSMLNIKYIIGRGKQVSDFALGNPIYKSNQSTIYRN
ncbi:MAG: YfhO family protein, partial [Acutalibacteraceae bacterium]